MKWKNLGTETCVFFITGTITEWQPLFMRPEVKDILLKDLEFYRSKYNARIIAYVIMPEHHHILLELNRPRDLAGWLRDVQGYSANEISSISTPIPLIESSSPSRVSGLGRVGATTTWTTTAYSGLIEWICHR